MLSHKQLVAQRYRASPRGRALRVAYETKRVRKRKAEDTLYAKRKWYKRKYGISLEELILLFCDQGCACGICGSTVPGRKQKYWCLDHNHSKKPGDVGFIRGILCFSCNTGGGSFNDDPSLLIAAAAWFSK